MKTLLITAVVATTSLFAGCASYSATTDSQQIAANVHRIKMRGNAFSSDTDAQDFALVKAAEVTIDSGHRFFTIMDSTDKSRTGTYTAPGSVNSTTNTSASLWGNSMQATSTTSGTYTPGQSFNFVKPGVDVMIETHATMPPQGAFDALEVGKYLGATVNPDRWAGEDTQP